MPEISHEDAQRLRSEFAWTLGREPDDDGFWTYLEDLAAGRPWAEIQGAIRTSRERRRVEDAIALEVLGRPLQNAERELVKGLNVWDVRRVLIDSEAGRAALEARVDKGRPGDVDDSDTTDLPAGEIPIDTGKRPPMRWERHQDDLRGQGLLPGTITQGRFFGFGLLNALSNRDCTPQGAARAMALVADVGGNLVRGFATLKVNRHREKFRHHRHDRDEWGEVRDAFLLAGRSRGVWFQLCVADDPARTSVGYTREDNCCSGCDRLTAEVLRDLLGTQLPRQNELLMEALIPEICNEGDKEFISNDDHRKAFEWLHTRRIWSVCNVRGEREYEHGLVAWRHLDSRAPAEPDEIPGYLARDRARFGKPVGLSTDGAHLLESSRALESAKAAWRAGHSVEVNLQRPLVPWDPDREVDLGFYDRDEEFQPREWRGRRRATTRWVCEQVAKALGVL